MATPTPLMVEEPELVTLPEPNPVPESEPIFPMNDPEEPVKVSESESIFPMNEPTPEQITAAGGETGYRKWKSVNDGTINSIKYAKKHGVKIAFGTDLWGPAMDVGITKEFTARKAFFTNVEILKQATSINGELLRLTGKLNPYPAGPIGVIEEGAYADILLVDGNPIEKIELLVEPEKNLKIIMKDGVIYKNTL